MCFRVETFCQNILAHLIHLLLFPDPVITLPLLPAPNHCHSLLCWVPYKWMETIHWALEFSRATLLCNWTRTKTQTDRIQIDVYSLCNHPLTLWPSVCLRWAMFLKKPKLAHDIWIICPLILHQIYSPDQNEIVWSKSIFCPSVFHYLTSSFSEATVSIVAQEMLLLGAGLGKDNVLGELRYSECGFLLELVSYKPNQIELGANASYTLSLSLCLNLVGLCSTAMSVGEGGCLLPPSPSSSVL